MMSLRVAARSICLGICLSAVWQDTCPELSGQTVRVPTYTHSHTTGAVWLMDLKESCSLLFLPTLRCMGTVDQKNQNILNFFNVDGTFSYINQIKSIYNGASSSATVSADIGTLTFGSGWQLSVGTNIQAGSTNAPSVAPGTVPTLSSTAAAQVTQNMLYGGTIAATAVLPLSFYGNKENQPDGVVFLLDLVGREGVDLQNFKQGTTTTTSAPPSHASAQLQGYLQYNSINIAAGQKNSDQSDVPAGAVFIGGSYGYNYNSHDYARDYGFGTKVSSAMGQVSAGILLNGIAKITISRAFGPSQTYIDGTTMKQTTVNNFKSWSFGISYQSPPPAAQN